MEPASTLDVETDETPSVSTIPLMSASRSTRWWLPVTAAVALAAVWIVPAVGGVPEDAAPAPPTPPSADASTGPLAGMVWPEAPNLQPIPDAPTIEHLRKNILAGDDARALAVAERFVAQHRWGRDRDVAWFTIGLLHREHGRHNLASEAFTKVRSSKGPLAAMGAYYEAEQDSARGRHWVAIRECERYQRDWPSGQHVGACQAIIATSHARLGRHGAARSAASEYDEDHPHAPIAERVELDLALWEARHHPKEAIGSLQALANTHSAPLTGRTAVEALEQLREAGHANAVLLDDTDSLKARALSLRDAKRTDAAWALYEVLVERAKQDPELAKWVDGSAEAFGWRTRRWDALAELYAKAYAEKADSEVAWDRYRVLERGGRYAEAIEQAKLGLKAHGKSSDWYRKEEAIARTFMLGGDYLGARDLMDQRAARGGWSGRRASFYAAFSSLMAGDTDDAIQRFDALIAKNRSYVTESHYWRARALQQAERLDEAQVEFDWVLTEAPNTWYSLLARQHRNPSGDGMAVRDGTWPGPQPAETPEPDSLAVFDALHPISVLARPVAPKERARAAGFEVLAWPMVSDVAPVAAPPIPSIFRASAEEHPPEHYRASAHFDPREARGALYRFAEANQDLWPELRAVWDLSRAGLYDLSGPLMSAAFEDWKEARSKSSHPRHAEARKVFLNTAEWRALFLFARDHHHAARFTYELWEGVEDPGLADEAWRLAYPLAHDRMVWSTAQDNDVDPYLVLGLMRQESTYNAIAVSRVGARGAMQIMPRTGYLLADRLDDRQFHGGQLEDPLKSVSYGIQYLGLLLDRYEDAYPLAVASYNAGPFNVSSWLAGTGDAIAMDAFVEHIPFRETRDYVKKVSAGYAAYVDLYAGPDAAIVLPETPRGNHPEVVDF